MRRKGELESSFYIYALIYDICFSFSDLLHSVWQPLGPSVSPQMAQFHSIVIYTTSFLSIPLLMGI